MTNKEIAVVIKQIVPGVGFTCAVKPPIIFRTPVGHTLQGLYFESHRHDAKLFYVWAFLLPLCVPEKHVSFTFGARIGGAADRWNKEEPDLVSKLSTAIKNEGAFFLRDLSVSEVIDAIKKLKGRSDDHYVRQAVAYLLARSGDTTASERALRELQGLLDRSIAWQAEMADRAEILVGQLRKGSETAIGLLQKWERQSVEDLKLSQTEGKGQT